MDRAFSVERRPVWAHTPAMVRRRSDDRGLITLLFTDIVGSSDVATELGDQRWHRLQARHHATVRKQLKKYGGHEVDTAGDGFFVTFASPARGVRCAFAIVREVRELGLDVRAGLHIGEAELRGEKVGGIAVTTAARVSAAADPGQVLATDTIVHLVAGSGFEFTDLGSHELKGVPGTWQLFGLDAVDGESIGAPLDDQQATEYRDRASPPQPIGVRRRLVWPAATGLVVALGAIAILANQRDPSQPKASPTRGVTENVAVLSTSGNVLFRPAGGGRGPILLTGPQGLAQQAFAWTISSRGGSVGISALLLLQVVSRTNGDIVDEIPYRDSYCLTPPGCLAEAGGKVWVFVPAAGSEIPDLNAVQPPRGQYAQGVDLTTHRWTPRLLVGHDLQVAGFVAGQGALWIGNSADGKVYRLDLRTGRVTPYATHGNIDDLAFGDGYVWAMDRAGTAVTRIDPKTRATKPAPLNGSGTLSSIGVGGGYVWITDDTDDEVWRMSTDMRSVRAITVGDRPDDVVYAAGAVWVANYGDETISKVEPGLAEQIATYPVGIRPRYLAVSDGEIWVGGDIPST